MLTRIIVAVFLLGIPVSSIHADTNRLRVGGELNLPVSSISADGTAQGLFPDVFQDIARNERWNFEYVACSWNQCLEDLASGKLDILLATAYSDKRAEQYDFSNESLLSNWGQIYVSSAAKVDSILQLEGNRIAVVRNDIHGIAFRKLLNDFGKRAMFLEVDSLEDVLQQIDAGIVDAGVVNRLFGQKKSGAYNVKSTTVVFNPIEIKFAVAKGRHANLLAAIDRNVSKQKQLKDSVYNRSFEKWLNMASGRSKLPSWFWAAISLILFTSAGLAAGVVLLRAEVRRKTMALVHAKEEAEMNLRLYSATLDNSFQFQGLLTPEGTIINVNKTSLEIIGKKREDVIGKPFWDAPWWSHDPDEQARIKDAVKQSAGGCPVRFEATNQNAQGEILYVDFSLRPVLSESGSVIYLIPEGHDVSSRKALETQLLQSQKMESIGRLAGGVAHDFNNMLGVILISAETAKRKAPAGNSIEKFLSTIITAAERSSLITKQLLAFSRKQTVSPVLIKLNDQITESRKLLSRLITEDINFTFQPCSNLWNIKLDPSQLDQILMNLVVNARDAMPDGGTLLIKTENVVVSPRFNQFGATVIPGKYIRLSLSDTGCGMSKDVQAKIFEPFFTTKQIGKGTGLGLSTVFGIVTQNSGFIDVYSEPGQGTIFNLYFPKYNSADVPGELPAPSDQQGGTGTILLVEDEAMLLETIAALLEDMGYHVIQASNPADALEYAQDSKQTIDLLLTDIIMPGMNGREMAQKILAVRPDLPVLYMSGYNDDVIASRGMLEQGTHFIQKPVDILTLQEKLKILMV